MDSLEEIAHTFLMVKPIKFGFNSQTAVNNKFQKCSVDENSISSSENIQKQALSEFEQLVEKLRQNHINLLIIEDTLEPYTPDSIFPNNWISTHFKSNSTCIYPMFAENRRLERKYNVLNQLDTNFVITKKTDLTIYENEGLFLEGTGSMIFDRKNGIIYASRSIRMNEIVLSKFYEIYKNEFGKLEIFSSYDKNKNLIYHTNVMMNVCDSFAVVCLDSVINASERNSLIKTLSESGKDIIEITMAQMEQFAGNMLQVRNSKGDKYLVMSERAYKSLNIEQIRQLKKYNEIIYSNLTTIEDNGGGSARCMIAEIFLKPKANGSLQC